MSSASRGSFYWHDYETFGADPARDRPAQFAGLRTDLELNPIGEPLVLFCRPAPDFLPQPRACLLTGITPQRALAEGVRECEFISRIHEELAAPGTCGVGYNSLRFDDEVTRHTLYRNFFDPYGREWRDGNSRWDIIDLLRTTCALRPDGIVWPTREDGLPSFRLGDLTAANGIHHADAHDALADVQATIALARLVRERQPKLFDYLLHHRDKQSAATQLALGSLRPVLHISGMFGAQRHHVALIVPLALHPENRNEVICCDLDTDPGLLFDLDASTLRELLYTRTAELPAGARRPGLKSVHLNRCPVLLPPKLLDAATAARLELDGERCRRHLAVLRDARALAGTAFDAKLQEVFTRRSAPQSADPDLMLYSGGFFSDQDRRTMDAVRRSSPAELASNRYAFDDARLPEMLFRYRARNYPETLTGDDQAAWAEFCYERLTDPDAGASICLENYHAEIEALQADEARPEADRLVLDALLDYSDGLLADGLLADGLPTDELVADGQ